MAGRLPEDVQPPKDLSRILERIDATERELQRLPEDRHARDAEGVADLLRLLGPCTEAEIADRTDGPAQQFLGHLAAARRALTVTFAGQSWWIAVEDASRMRDALGVPLPVGTPTAFEEAVTDPLGDLVARYARTHGPFSTAQVAARFAIGPAVAESVLRRLALEKRLVEGEFRPGAAGSEWCEAGVLRRLRRRSGSPSSWSPTTATT